MRIDRIRPVHDTRSKNRSQDRLSVADDRKVDVKNEAYNTGGSVAQPGLCFDHRNRPDRRQRPTPFLSRYTFWGRRKRNRRESDPQKNYYVDRIGGRYMAAIIVIFVLSVADSLFTVYHIEKGGVREVNPLLNAFLFNNAYFLIVKYILTLVGIIALCLHKFFTLVRELVIVLIVGYVILNIYQVWLLRV